MRENTPEREKKEPLDYLVTSYQNTPLTNYPNLLAQHLFDRLSLTKGNKLLEIGCGRGEFLNGFKKAGCDVYGTDMCISSKEFCPNIDISVTILGQEPLPFEDQNFDVVFSKSLLEHLPTPDIFMEEALRVLKPGGYLVTMTPDWESCYKTFYDDFTHVCPYSVRSLQMLYEMYKLNSITVEKFYQLPIVWEKPAIKYLCRAIAPFIPVAGVSNKFLRWSRELMLLGIAKK